MRKFIPFLVLLFFALPLFADGSAIVLCYHTFLGKKIEYDFKPEDFKKQLESYQALGYHFVSFDDILSNKITGNNNILLTIDDGNRSVKPVFEGILKPAGIKPVLFIYPAITDRMFFSLKFKDLQEFADDGATIGGHGYYHMYVAQKMYDQDPKGFMKEIYKCKERLEQHLNLTVSIYAYPFGVFSDITEETLKKAGYSYAFSLRHASLEVPLSKNKDAFNLPRYMVTKSNWKEIYQFLKDNINAINHVKIGTTNANG